MRLLNLSINFIVDFCPHLGSFSCFSHYVSAKFHLWPSSLSLYGSRCVLSEDSGFNSYSIQPEVYLVKNGVKYTASMESSNYWGYGYKTQHSYPRSRLITWKRSEVKFGRNIVRKTTTMRTTVRKKINAHITYNEYIISLNIYSRIEINLKHLMILLLT